MPNQKVFIVFHGRFPSEKAAALFVAENARSMATYYPITILVPRRFGSTGSVKDSYALQKSVLILRLPSIDLFWLRIIQTIAFYISLFTFSISVWFKLRCLAHKGDIVICNDILVGLAASYTSGSVVYEVHDYPQHWHALVQYFFNRTSLIIATNHWKEQALKKDFPQASKKIYMERNGVSLEDFSHTVDKHIARTTLGLSETDSIVVYTGHLYSWKGVDTLAKAAMQIPGVKVICVGGTKNDVEAYRIRYASVKNIIFTGHVAHLQVPIWQAAADVLVLPNTAKEEISTHYTSPMKLFEYMASNRPIVASAIESITEVVNDKSAYICPPDDPTAMAMTITQALTNSGEAHQKVQSAKNIVQKFSWQARAQRLHQQFNHLY